MTYEGLKLLSVELQRIANALDRLVSIESRKAKLLEEELDPNQKK